MLNLFKWKTGDRAWARLPIGDNGVYAATIVSFRREEVLLDYDDGSRCWVDFRQVASLRFWEGMAVHSRREGEIHYFPGTITSFQGNTICVRYQDGGHEWTTPAFLRLDQLPPESDDVVVRVVRLEIDPTRLHPGGDSWTDGYSPITEYPAGHNVPQLVRDFIEWIAQLETRGLGHFETSGESLESFNWFTPDVKQRIVRDAFVLLDGGDGAKFMLFKVQEHQHAVVMMDHSEIDVVALSFEEFLIRLSRGELGHSSYFDSDDEWDNVAETRLALQEWISERGVAEPASIIDFNFEAYLDGDFDLAFRRMLPPN